jgi:hypothetical protein
MGRVNKTIEGVFIDIVGSSSELSSYDQFINHGDGKKYSKELEELTALYKKEVTKSKVMFEKLASLEEIIIQMRIREDLSDIKLTQVREYIYARTPFYRKDKKSKDVRVIVDKIEFHPESDGNLEILLGNKDFMEKAKNKLAQAMDLEILENIKTFNSSFKK